MNKEQAKFAVYVRAQGFGKWSFRSILAEMFRLFSFCIKISKHSEDMPWYERCFDVENERYAYLLALQEQRFISRVEHWHFVSFGNRFLSTAICHLLDFVGQHLHGVAQRYLAFDANNFDMLREKVMTLLGRVSVMWVDGSQDRCLPWSQISEIIAESVFTICYPVNYYPWRFSDVQNGRYDMYLYDEPWQMAEIKMRLNWAREVRFLEFIKIPNYVQTFVATNSTKDWDICVPGYIKEGKNQVEVLKTAAVAARKMGVRLKVIVVGGIEDVPYSQKVRECINEHRKEILVDFKGHLSRAKLAQHIGRSRMVLAAAKWDTAPRIVQEALCCNTPVLMNQEMLCGSKYIVADAGLLKPLGQFSQGIIEILTDQEKFQPRASFLNFVTPEETLLNFVRVVVNQSGRNQNKQV